MNEYGGYLPLELYQLHNDLSVVWNGISKNNIMLLNSGRAAIYYALQIMQPTKIYIPYYICHTVVDVIKKLGIVYEFYNITHSLQCHIQNVKKTHCVLVVNYFGICDKYIDIYTKCYDNLIIDNTQALFCEPILKKGVYNIYSYRKFIGVSDGGALVSQDIIQQFEIKQDESYSRTNYLIKSIELGTNSAYSDYKETIKIFSERYLRMSKFTQRLLLSVNYTYIQDKRIENYIFLDSKLRQYNRLKSCELGCACIPCWYPLLLDIDISGELIKNKIYVPRLWQELCANEFKPYFEYELSSNLILLPIDQRYDIIDMSYIANIVKKIYIKGLE